MRESLGRAAARASMSAAAAGKDAGATSYLGGDFFGAAEKPEQEKDYGQRNSEENKSSLAVKSSRQKSRINAGSQHSKGIDAQPVLDYGKRNGHDDYQGLAPG